MSAPRSVFIVAGEASGDRLGAALMRGLRAEASARGEPTPTFEGVGGVAMAAQGFESLFPISDVAVMGLTEVLPRLRTILRRVEETAQAMIAAAPDIIVT
ncbi:MAG: lipid-A-disaccharide synthase, partial [Pseudomonadota bacterium]